MATICYLRRVFTATLIVASFVIVGIAFWRGTRVSTVFRFGHAFPPLYDPNPGDAIGDVLGLLRGSFKIGPRPPIDSSSVWYAESLLRIDRGRRPVYAYVGNLNPALGTVGVILRPTWFGSNAHGVSRCDTGGLAGRKEGFQHVETTDVEIAMRDLTHGPNGWQPGLVRETQKAFRSWEGYLRGETPKTTPLDRHRRKCIESVLLEGKTPDRRLWTWEARVFGDVEQAHVEFVVLSPQAYKGFLRRGGRTIPRGTPVIRGSTDGGGVHHFHEERVIRAFLGGAL
jgi:hypothetical protein